MPGIPWRPFLLLRTAEAASGHIFLLPTYVTDLSEATQPDEYAKL